MLSRRLPQLAAAIAALVLAQQGHTHSFGEPYKLPLPYWHYIYAAMAALVLSFVAFAYFFRHPADQHTPSSQTHLCWEFPTLTAWIDRLKLRVLGQALVSGGFILAIVTGLFGSADPYRNFNMTFFWIGFTLGGLYLSALVGDWYRTFNPWRQLCERLPGLSLARIHYPAALAYWPAVVLYMAFIGIELFADISPLSLSVILLCYTAINLAGAYVFGSRCWFHYGEFFAVLFRLCAWMAPLTFKRVNSGNIALSLRLPFSGLIDKHPHHFSLVIFTLFMLSSTAFDGLRETALWFNLFWKDPFDLLTPLLGQNPIYLYVSLRPWYLTLEVLTLLLSPFLYLAAFVAFLWLGKILIRSRLRLGAWVTHFAFSLLPIALVYHLTHYYSLLLSQGVKLRALLSDPFGWGWNLFGTAITGRIPVLPDMGFIWNSQVWLILVGHVASVMIAHVQALTVFPNSRAAGISQVPMLMLMVLFTGIGLWILAQPLQG